MNVLLLAALWAAVTYGLYYIANKYTESRTHADRAKELGCDDAPLYPYCGFFGLRLLGNMLYADWKMIFPDFLITRTHEMTAHTGRNCTTFKQYMLGQESYFTSDPINLRAILSAQFKDYDLGSARRGNFGQTLGDGIFVQDGNKWSHSRALLRPNFAREQVSDLDLEERHVQNLMRAMPVRADGWTDETNIQTLFFRLTIDSATEFLFGESVDSQINEAAGADRTHAKDERAFSKAFSSALGYISTRLRLGNLYWLYHPWGYTKSNKVVNNFISHYVDLALSKSNESQKDGKEAQGKRNHYIFLEALAQQTQDPIEIRAQLLNILLAGRDTTASLLSWLFRELLRNPDEYAKLRKIVVDDFGTYDSPRDISFATLKGCQYLQWSLNEANRLWSVIPGNIRRSNKATTLPTGGGPDGTSRIYIKPETDIVYSIHVLHRRKDIWGDDADVYKPSRFVERKGAWEYLPFNGGPRVCIGQQFALTEAGYVTVRLLQRFEKMEAAEAYFEGKTLSNLTLSNCPGKPVTVRMKEARD